MRVRQGMRERLAPGEAERIAARRRFLRIGVTVLPAIVVLGAAGCVKSDGTTTYGSGSSRNNRSTYVGFGGKGGGQK